MATKTVTDIIAEKARSGEKFGDWDVTPELARAAYAYLADYRGSFEFILDLRRRSNGRSLSNGQLRGVLNTWRSEVARELAASVKAPTAAPAAQTVELRNGLYTVVLDDGERRTLRVREGEQDDFPQFVSFLSGSDNESAYTCCGYVKGGVYRWTKRFAANESGSDPLAQAVRFLLAADEERRTGFGRAYALESGNCYRCNRTLTDPTSIELGIGPVCRTRE